MEPFINVEYSPLATPGQISQYASQVSGNFQAIQIGAGAESYKADRTGIWLGANTFAGAPFSVDMQGNVWANSIVIAGLDGSVIATSIDANGNFVKQLISTNFDTQAKQILGEFTFAGSGAIAIKTDASNGLWLSPTGILAKKAGATTFAIDTAGNATFSGNISASTITGGYINGGTITGALIQTTSGSTGSKLVFDSSGVIKMSYNGVQYGTIGVDSSTNIIYASNTNHQFFIGAGNQMAVIDSGGLSLPAGSSVRWSTGRALTDASSAIRCNGDFVDNNNRTHSLGYYNDKEWNHIYCRQGHFSNVAWADNWYTNSDKRLKKNIRQLDKVSVLEKIKQLNGKIYELKDPEKQGIDHVGLIAQEVELIFPGIVSQGNDFVSGRNEDDSEILEHSDIKSIAYQQLIPYLIEAIKELSEQIELLKNNKK